MSYSRTICDSFDIASRFDNGRGKSVVSDIKTGMTFRFADESDWEHLYEWEQHPEAAARRPSSFFFDPFENPETYHSFFNLSSSARYTLYLIAEKDGERLGAIRYDKAQWGSRYEVGYIVNPDHFRKGYGSVMLQATQQIFQDNELFAHVESNHDASIKILERSGFREAGQKGAYQIMTRPSLSP